MSGAVRFHDLLATTCAAIVLASLLPARLPAPHSVVAGDPTSPVSHPLPHRSNAAPANWDLEIAVLNLINHERTAAGRPALIPHSTIRSVARSHGVELFAAGILTHRSADGRSPQQRVLDRHVRVRMVGENLAYAADVQSAHDALMASQAHRHNILAPEYVLVGVGVLDAGLHGVIIVQNFADAPTGVGRPIMRPARRPAAFAPRPGSATAAGLPSVHVERKPLH
jgi:uncharacterized protein YkwD